MWAPFALKTNIALKSGPISHTSLDLQYLLEDGNKLARAADGASTPVPVLLLAAPACPWGRAVCGHVSMKQTALRNRLGIATQWNSPPAGIPFLEVSALQFYAYKRHVSSNYKPRSTSTPSPVQDPCSKHQTTHKQPRCISGSESRIQAAAI